MPPAVMLALVIHLFMLSLSIERRSVSRRASREVEYQGSERVTHWSEATLFSRV